MSPLWLLATLGWISLTAAQQGLGIFFVEEPRSQVALPGAEAVLTCATNLAVDHLGWLRDWRPLEPGSDPTMEVQPGRLLIRVGRDPDTYRSQMGQYRCMAWIAPIGLSSLPASLGVAHIEPFAARANTTLVAPPGGTVSVRCPAPASEPPASVQFYRDGQPLPERGESHLVLPGGSLHLSDVRSSQAGVYSCSARNSRTGQQVAAPFFTRLEVGAPEQMAPPRLVVAPKPVYRAAVGGTVRLECVADGWPVPSVSWRRLDDRWTDRYVQHAASLEIRQLRPADEGDYVCEVSGSGGPLTAATVLRLDEPPSVETSPSDLKVPEGAPAELSCAGRGQPPPQLQWVLDGRPVLGGRQLRVRGGRLQFDVVTRRDAGLYQCFGHSESGDAKAAVLLKVIPKTTTSLQSPPSRPATLTSSAPPVARKSSGHRRSHSPRRRAEALMVPPGAPSVYPISESSVMLQWEVPPNDGLAILFFKIQYRRAPRRRHQWQTHDSDIPGTARSFAVDGLQLGAKYKFRVLAVYENKDNKHGPNSRKVKMTRMHKKSKPPGAPVITMHRPQSPTSILCSWKYYNLQSAPIEGYFIYYRDTTTAGDYSKVTVLGETTKTYTLTALQPTTAYDIKVQAFNLAGGVSEFSPIVTERTLAAPGGGGGGGSGGGAAAGAGAAGGRRLRPVVAGGGAGGSRTRLYSVVGGVLGGLLTLAALVVVVCHCRSRMAAKHESAPAGSGRGAHESSVRQPLSPGQEPAAAEPGWPEPDGRALTPPPAAARQMAACSETSFCRPVELADQSEAAAATLNNNKYCASAGAGHAGRRSRRVDGDLSSRSPSARDVAIGRSLELMGH